MQTLSITPEPIAPRVLSRVQAAAYLGVSPATVDRLVASGVVRVVQLPVTRDAAGNIGVPGGNRRVLLDRAELDALVDANRVSRGVER